MSDILDKLAKDVQQTINSGYYKTNSKRNHDTLSLTEFIDNCEGNAVITEIKTASPSLGARVGKINLKNAARQTGTYLILRRFEKSLIFRYL